MLEHTIPRDVQVRGVDKYMKYKEFEKQLKKIDPNLNIRSLEKYKVNDVVEVYWKDSNGNSESVCAMPPEINEKRVEGYTDEFGRTHRCMEEVIAIATGFIERIKNDPEFLEDIMNKEV